MFLWRTSQETLQSLSNWCKDCFWINLLLSFKVFTLLTLYLPAGQIRGQVSVCRAWNALPNNVEHKVVAIMEPFRECISLTWPRIWPADIISSVHISWEVYYIFEIKRNFQLFSPLQYMAQKCHLIVIPNPSYPTAIMWSGFLPDGAILANVIRPPSITSASAGFAKHTNPTVLATRGNKVLTKPGNLREINPGKKVFHANSIRAVWPLTSHSAVILRHF